MPLLGKNVFQRQQLPPNLNPEEEIFYCKTTKEAFLTYDEFFERQILCSSMVWTCTITGRTGLTYVEAEESERAANELLNSFPVGLQIPVLFLMNYINESKFGSIVDMIYTFISNRYFIAEEIEMIVNTKRKSKGRVFRVIPPSYEQIKKSKAHSFGINPDLYKYEIIDNEKNRKIMGSDKVVRTKSLVTKDKIRLFLKQHLTQEKRMLPMFVKESSKTDFRLNNIQWEHLFDGPEPIFEDQTLNIKPNSLDKSLNSKQISSEVKKSKVIEQKNKCSKTTPINSGDNKETLREKKLEMKRIEKQQKRQLEENLKEWNAKRDDLSCDDLRPLPVPIPLKCKIPVELFADSVFVMEFIHCFNNLFDIKPIFPSNLTFDLMEQILFDVDVCGPFGDFVKMLLNSNFILREEEGESTQTGDKIDTSDDEDRHNTEEERNDKFIDTSGDKNAFYFQNWIESHLGVQLSEISLDPFNITEVLRLYLLSSSSGHEPRSKYRGLYNCREDPSIEFVAQNEIILNKLKTETIFDLKPEERLKIFKVLIHQLLTFFEFREQIDDCFDEMAKQRKKIRDIQTEFNKWIKDNSLKRLPNKKDSQNENQKSVSLDNQISVSTTEQLEEYRKEKEHKEEELSKSCAEIRAQIRKLQACYGLKPIGFDRAFRRYWIFESLPGLFVEHMKPSTRYTDMPFGPCLEAPTPNKSLKPKCVENIYDKSECSQKSLRDDSSTTSDKENESNPISASNNGDKANLANLSHFDKCTANINTCAVHGSADNLQFQEWTFYYSLEHFNGLIESLNCRGFRESELMFALNRDRNLILDYMNKCQSNKLNTDLPAPEARRSQRLQEVFHSRKGKQWSDMSPNESIKSALKEYLISLEERIFAGSLAVVTELSRTEWRQAVERHHKDKHELIRNLSKSILMLTKSIRPMCLSSPLSEENSVFQNWSQSLCESTGLSQLFLHLSVLEQSIKWDKCALKACCKICRRKCDAENMLLCDRCNRGHHIYCLQPSLNSIPQGEWLCPDCGPKFKPQTPKKEKRDSKPIYESSSEYDTSDNEEESDYHISRSNSPSKETDVCAHCKQLDLDLQLSCAKCHNYYHLSCANVQRITRSDWFCINCSNNKKRKLNEISINISDESDSSDESSQSESSPPTRRSRKSRYSQDFDYFDGKFIEEEKIKKLSPNVGTTTRGRLGKSSAAFRGSLPLDFGVCEDILRQLQRHNDGWLFRNKPNHAPNYKKVIKEYVDFGQLVSKLNNMSYTSNLQLFRDILLMLNNAMFYNPIDSSEYKSCQSLAQYFEELLKQNGFHLNSNSLLNF